MSSHLPQMEALCRTAAHWRCVVVRRVSGLTWLSDDARVGFDVLLDDIRADLNDLARIGRVSRADELSRATGQQFHATAVPQYFTGDLSAPLVLVHLNPKQDGRRPGRDRYTGPVPTLDGYLDEYTLFGRGRYGPSSPRTHRSPFDHKQIRFLRPFNAINFIGEDEPDARSTNLQRVIDDKLQLEVIPYQSVTFSRRGMTEQVLAPHYRRLLATITAAPRQYVIFCGRVLADLLRGWVVQEHQFPLVKKDGTRTAGTYRFANLLINQDGHLLYAGLAPSFSRQGIPMTAYGAECAARYRTG
jgi:hypothetical protein